MGSREENKMLIHVGEDKRSGRSVAFVAIVSVFLFFELFDIRGLSNEFDSALDRFDSIQ